MIGHTKLAIPFEYYEIDICHGDWRDPGAKMETVMPDDRSIIKACQNLLERHADELEKDILKIMEKEA